MEMRQHSASHDEKAGAGHHDPDNHVYDFVEPLEREPVGEAEMGKLARHGLLRGKRKREDQPGGAEVIRQLAQMLAVNDRDDHGGIFRALAFVNGRGIGRYQHVEFAKSVSDGSTVKAGNDLACIGVDVVDIADVAVVDLLIVIVLDLHDLVAGGEGPAEPLHLAITGGVERCLQFDVQ